MPCRLLRFGSRDQRNRIVKSSREYRAVSQNKQIRIDFIFREINDTGMEAKLHCTLSANRSFVFHNHLGRCSLALSLTAAIYHC